MNFKIFLITVISLIVDFHHFSFFGVNGVKYDYQNFDDEVGIQPLRELLTGSRHKRSQDDSSVAEKSPNIYHNSQLMHTEDSARPNLLYSANIGYIPIDNLATSQEQEKRSPGFSAIRGRSLNQGFSPIRGRRTQGFSPIRGRREDEIYTDMQGFNALRGRDMGYEPEMFRGGDAFMYDDNSMFELAKERRSYQGFNALRGRRFDPGFSVIRGRRFDPGFSAIRGKRDGEVDSASGMSAVKDDKKST